MRNAQRWPFSSPCHQGPQGCGRVQEAGGLSHLLTVSLVTAFLSLNQLLLLYNRFNNTCQLLKRLGFVLWVNSLTGVTRTTDQLLRTSWQWCGCRDVLRRWFQPKGGMTWWSRTGSLSKGHNNTGSAKSHHVPSWLWSCLLLAASFWHTANLSNSDIITQLKFSTLIYYSQCLDFAVISVHISICVCNI